MKKIYYTLLLGLLITRLATAQEEVSGKLSLEDPDPDFFELHLPFLALDFSPSNSTIFADFGGKFKKGNFFLNADYRIDYANGLEEFYYNVEQNTANSIYSEKAPKHLLATVGYIFLKDQSETTVDFHLKTVGGGRSSTAYYTRASSAQTKFWMADLGLRKGFNQVQCTGKKLTFESADGSDADLAPAPASTRTMMDYTMIQAGISFGKIGYWEAQIKEYGLRRSEKFVRFYADLLYLVSSSIDPIYYNLRNINPNIQKDLYTRYDLNNSKRSKLGICLGATTNNISRFGIQAGAELGYMPGIAGSVKSNISFTINSNISIGKVFE